MKREEVLINGIYWETKLFEYKGNYGFTFMEANLIAKSEGKEFPTSIDYFNILQVGCHSIKSIGMNNTKPNLPDGLHYVRLIRRSEKQTLFNKIGMYFYKGIAFIYFNTIYRWKRKK